MDILDRNSDFEAKIQKNILRIKKNRHSLELANSDSFENKQSNWIEKISDFLMVFVLAAICFGLPTFSTGGQTLQGIVFDKQVNLYFLFSLVIFTWLVSSAMRGEIKIRRTPLDVPIAIFWFAYLLSTIFSVDKWHSFWGFFGDPTHGFLNLTVCLAFYYVVLSNFSLKLLRIMLGAIFLSGLALLIGEILKITGAPNSDLILQYIPLSRIGSATGTTIFLSLLVILLVTVFLKIRDSRLTKMQKIILQGIFLAMILAALYILLAYYFFVPWAGFFIGAGFFLIYLVAGVAQAPRSSLRLPGFVFACILIIMLFGDIFSSNIKLAAVQIPTEIELGHKLSWQIAKNALTENNFFLGSGPSTYGYDFSLYRPQEINLSSFYNTRFYKASGILWEMLSTVGVLGTFAFVLLVVSFLSVGIYFISREKRRSKIYSVGLMSATIMLLIDVFFVRLDASIFGFIFLMITLTLGIILLENETAEEYFRFSLRPSPKYALTSIFVFLTISAGVVFLWVLLARVFVADVSAGIANKQKNLTEEDSVKMFARAIDFYGKEGRYYTLCGQKYIALANKEFLKGDQANVEIIKKHLDDSIALALKGKELMPKDVLAAEVLAQIYENKSIYFADFYDQTISAYKDALALEPHNATYLLKIGKILTMQANLEKNEDAKKALITESKDWFQKSVDEKNNLAEAQYQLGVTQQLLGETDNAVDSFEKAIAVDNTKADYFFSLANAFQLRGKEGDYETAENIYKNIISVQGNDINTYLSLGLLYEKMKRFGDASEQYENVLGLLPEGNRGARNKIQKMIDNTKKGLENTAENLIEPAAIDTN